MEAKSNPTNELDQGQKNNGGWQQVTYAKKKQQKNKKNQATKKPSSDPTKNIIDNGTRNVFESLEKHAAERRKNVEARKTADIYDDDGKFLANSSNHRSENGGSGKSRKNGAMEEKEKKKKKEKKEIKKTNVTVAEAAMKIDGDDLSSFLADVSVSYASQEEIQLTRFADYFGRAFSAVSAAQFPWLELFKESSLDAIADIPVCHIKEVVYRTSVDWINQLSNESLESFMLWSLDCILADLTIQKAGSKGPKKGVQTSSSKSQVATFVVVSMILRRKPDIMIHLLPILRANSKYHGQNKLPLYIWMIIQASQGDLTVGLYLWAHYVLPILGAGSKSSSNPQTRDLVLQLAERILSRPNAYKILVNGAVRKGERLMPPLALDLLLHVTFPASSTPIKATDRFEAIYPTLVYVALAGTPRSKSMKQLALQVQDFAMKATLEGNPKLSQEATKLLLWCLTQNTECYKEWEKIYANNLETSVAILQKLNQRWPELASKLASADDLRDTLKSFRQKNEKALRGGMDPARQALLKEADQKCKVILKKMFIEQNRWMIIKLLAFFPILLAFAATFGYKEYLRRF
ncbi:uncharacterized protein [Coffea arabica]|uniref:Uncharacterized protein LOC113718555 n=1 Tax=Coffea arabica TaxID=13443 RepID=A0A6P6VBC2_COFAR|nr:uncharacterized protein LOC113718555 [Coffea arabica]